MSEPAGGDLPKHTGTTGRLVAGQAVTGRFHSIEDGDWFAVDLKRGYQYEFQIRAGETNPSDIPSIQGLYDDVGRTIGWTQVVSGRRQMSFTALRTGRYYIGLITIDSVPSNRDGIGTYVLTLTAEAGTLPPAPPPPDDYGEAMDDTTAQLPVGGSVTGVLNYVDDLTYGYDHDVFAMELVADQTYRIDIRRTTGGARLDLRGIYDAQGRQIPGTAAADYLLSYPHTRQWFTATTTGRHYIVVSSHSAPFYSGGLGPVHPTENYRLSVAAMEPSDDYTADPMTTGRVTVGGSVTGRFEQPRDEDWFAVDLEAARTYRIDLTREPEQQGYSPFGLDPYLAGVYAAASTRLPNTTNDDGGAYKNAQVFVTPSVTRTYYIAARSKYGDGEYELAVVDETDVPANTSTRKQVQVGGSVSSKIANDADVDWFAVEFVAGQTYRIDQNLGGPWWSPDLKGIHDAQGTLLANDDYFMVPYSAVRQWFTATTTGKHYIAAGGFLAFINEKTGTYTLSVVAMVPPDDYAADTTTTGRVTVGATVTGRFERQYDEDWWVAELLDGRTYRIDLTREDFIWTSSISGYYNPLKTKIAGVYTAESVLLPNTTKDSPSSPSDLRVSVTPSESGTYYIAARSAHGEGEYKLKVRPTDDYASNKMTTGRVMVGGSVMGEIGVTNDVDWIAVTLVAGTSYQIDLEGAPTGQGTLPDPYLKGVHDADGNWIAGTRDLDSGEGLNSRIQFTPQAPGTYYISVDALPSSIRTGSYRLSVTAV